MVEPANTSQSVDEQCKLLTISRLSFYDQRNGETAMDLILMRQI